MSTRLFFNRFPTDTAEQDLYDLFSQYGEVTEVTLFKSKETGEVFGRGYVTLNSPEAAQAAIQALNDMEIEGQPVRVKFDDRHSKRGKPSKATIPFYKEAGEVASLLGETAPSPRQTIRRAIVVMGLDFVDALLDETRQIEAQGGMLTQDGSRRRSPGGVFLALLKQRVTKEEFEVIFPSKTKQASSE